MLPVTLLALYFFFLSNFGTHWPTSKPDREVRVFERFRLLTWYSKITAKQRTCLMPSVRIRDGA